MLKIPLFKPYMSPRATEKVAEALYGCSNQVEYFESDLRQILNTYFVVAVNNATSAMHIACRICGVEAGKTVLTTPLASIATNSPILANNGKVRWLDIDPNTLTMDANDLEKKLSTDRYTAVIVTHLGGNPADMDKIKELCSERKIPIIEDCSHAWRATHHKEYVGCLDNFGVFSFHSNKHLNCDNGGALVCPNELVEKLAVKLRWYGFSKEEMATADIEEYGYNFSMNNISASLGRVNLQHDLNIHRRNVAERYDLDLWNVGGIDLVRLYPNTESSYYLYMIKVENRDNFNRMMEDKGIEVGFPYRRNDEYTIFKDFAEKLPNLDEVYGEITCLPCGWWVGEEQQQYILDCILEGW